MVLLLEVAVLEVDEGVLVVVLLEVAVLEVLEVEGVLLVVRIVQEVVVLTDTKYYIHQIHI